MDQVTKERMIEDWRQALSQNGDIAVGLMLQFFPAIVFLAIGFYWTAFILFSIWIIHCCFLLKERVEYNRHLSYLENMPMF